MNFTNKYAYSLVLASLSVVSAQSFAEGTRPSIAVAKLSVGHDDNMRQTDERYGKALESAYVNLRVDSGIDLRKGLYKLGAYVDTTSYIDSSDDNFIDTGFNASANYAISRRASASVGVNYTHGHDAVGSTDRATNKPETYDTVGINALLGYGREQSRGRIEASAGFSGKRYDEFGSQVKTEDTNTGSLMGTFFYRIQPKTELLFELSHQNIDYIANESRGRDNQYQKARVGAKWQATAKTSGSAKIGYARKDFTQSAASDFSGLDWEVAVDWKATPRSVVTLTTARAVSDSTTASLADYITNQSFGLSVLHNWTRRVNTTASVNFSNDEYGSSSRSDDNLSYSLGAEYVVNPNITVGGAYNGSTRDSNQDMSDYERNMFSVYVSGKY